MIILNYFILICFNNDENNLNNLNMYRGLLNWMYNIYSTNNIIIYKYDNNYYISGWLHFYVGALKFCFQANFVYV